MENPWKVIFAFLGVFVAGAVFGGFFSLGVGRRIWEMESPAAAKSAAVSAPAAQAQPAAPTGGAAALRAPVDVQRAQLMRRVANQLDLTPAQKGMINPIIQRAVQDMWRQQQNLFRETAFITTRMKQDIAKELTPEQQSRLDELWLKQLELFRVKQAEAQAQRRAEAEAKALPQQKSSNAAPAAPGGKPVPDGAPKPAEPGAKDQPVRPAKPPGDGQN